MEQPHFQTGSCGSQHDLSILENTIMRRPILTILAVLAGSLLATTSRPQLTNNFPVVPATKLESFETNIGSVVIKASAETGSFSVDSGLVSVRCREITDAASGRREQGIAIEFTQRD